MGASLYRGGSSLTCMQGGVQVFHVVMHVGAYCLLFSAVCNYPNINIISDARICMFAVLLRFTLSFVYKFNT